MLTPSVLEMILLGLEVGPDLIAAAQQEFDLLVSSTPPTADQRAAIDAALAQAHAALQAAKASS